MQEKMKQISEKELNTHISILWAYAIGEEKEEEIVEILKFYCPKEQIPINAAVEKIRKALFQERRRREKEEKEQMISKMIYNIDWEPDMTEETVIAVIQKELCEPLIKRGIQSHRNLCQDWIITRAFEYDEISNEALNKAKIKINKINDNCYIIQYRDNDAQCCTKSKCIEYLEKILNKWSHDKVMELSLMI